MARRQVYVALAVVAVLALVLVAAWFLVGKGKGGPDVAAAAVSGPNYVVLPSDRTLGNRNAKAVLIEYAAPICPHCAHFNEETFPPLKANYIDKGKLLYVFRVFPLHPADGVAEKLARCLPADKYFGFMDMLFRTQRDWDPEYGVVDWQGALVKKAQGAGLTQDAMRKCVNENKAEDDRINAVALDGQTRYNITGTPTLVLNGTPVGQGTVPSYDELKAAIDKVK